MTHLTAEAHLALALSVDRGDLKRAHGHLRHCRRCRDRSAELSCDEVTFENTEDRDERPPGRLFATIAARIEAGLADWKGSGALAEALLAHPADAQRGALLSDSQYLSPALAHRLLDRAESLVPTDPREALHRARLARTLARRLALSPVGIERATLLGRSWTIEGEANRHRGDLHAAKQALRRALREVETLPGSSPERAAFCRSLARLRWEQGREDEALALLGRALDRFEALPDRRRAEECRLELGRLLLEALEPEEALHHFEAALPDCQVTEVNFERWVAAQQGKALAYADLCRHSEARLVLAELTEALERRGPHESVRRAQITASLNRRLGVERLEEDRGDDRQPT